MTDIQRLAPLWGQWQVDKPLGGGAFTRVYQVSRQQLGVTFYGAVKHRHVPGEGERRRQFLFTGAAASGVELARYYEQETRQRQGEIVLLDSLRGQTHIVSLEDSAIVPDPADLGYDILLRMELLTGLETRLLDGPLPRGEVLRLGAELCRALAVLRDIGCLHRNIKPAHIYLNERGDYKLGGFGIARRLERVEVLPPAGTPFYLPPEVCRREPTWFTADIYSLGLVLYSLCNGNRPPFLPAQLEPYHNALVEAAMHRRLSGEPLPRPETADPALAAVILKACAAAPADRWQIPQEMEAALLSLSAAPLLLPDSPREEGEAQWKGQADLAAGAGAGFDERGDSAAGAGTGPDERGGSAAGEEAPAEAAISSVLIVLPTALGPYPAPVAKGEMELCLADLNITDASPLAELTGLLSLDLRENQLTELQPLAALTRLRSLFLDGNAISELAPLSALTRLSELSLWRNGVRSLAPLAGLLHLTDLELGFNEISDLTPLSGLTRLKSLSLFGNKIKDLAPLAQLSQLTELWLLDNAIADLTPLAGLKRLTRLELGGNRIEDLSPLAELTRLTALTLGHNRIQNAAPLAGLKRLTNLYLADNQLRDLTPLSALRQLTVLDLQGNRLQDLTPLSALRQLTRLDLQNNQIRDLSPLNGLTHLTVLFLYDNPLSARQLAALRTALPGCAIY